MYRKSVFLVVVFAIFSQRCRADVYRCTLNGASLFYHCAVPRNFPSYPIVILIGGSYVQQEGPQSIIGLWNQFEHSVIHAGFGFLALERRGVTPTGIDTKTFHRFNTPSQRLEDHKCFIEYLRRSEVLRGWNGQIVLIGGSEGGPIAIKLAADINPIGCVVIVGCGDQSFKEYIWETIQSIHSTSRWKSFFARILYRLPKNRSAYEKRCALMQSHPTPDRWWFGQTFLYWADALEQREKEAFLSLFCPILVISGSQDIELPSTERLIAKAKLNRQPITYVRIEGMGHDALSKKWNVIGRVMDFLKELQPRSPEDSAIKTTLLRQKTPSLQFLSAIIFSNYLSSLHITLDKFFLR